MGELPHETRFETVERRAPLGHYSCRAAGLRGEGISRHHHPRAARAAGVSEALLFKHFPNKEALFSAMQMAACTEQDIGRFERLKTLEPSSSTLVLMVHYLVSLLVGRTREESEDLAIQDRLLLRSLAEDGEFARNLYTMLATNWIPLVEACLRAAAAAGDTAEVPVPRSLGGWFTHSLPLMIRLLLLPTNPVVNFRVSRNALVEQTVWFILRGMGLKDAAIRRHYNPAALAFLNEE